MKKEIKNMNYKYNVSNIEVLLWESEQAAKPEEHVFTAPALENDLAWVSNENKAYVFKDNVWVEYIEHS